MLLSSTCIRIFIIHDFDIFSTNKNLITLDTRYLSVLEHTKYTEMYIFVIAILYKNRQRSENDKHFWICIAIDTDIISITTHDSRLIVFKFKLKKKNNRKFFFRIFSFSSN